MVERVIGSNIKLPVSRAAEALVERITGEIEFPQCRPSLKHPKALLCLV